MFQGYCLDIHLKKKQNQNKTTHLNLNLLNSCCIPGSMGPAFSAWVERLRTGLRLSGSLTSGGNVNSRGNTLPVQFWLPYLSTHLFNNSRDMTSHILALPLDQPSWNSSSVIHWLITSGRYWISLCLSCLIFWE